MLYTHDYAQFARLESVIRKLHSVDNCWTMKLAGNKTFIITLTPASKTALISEWLMKAIVKKKIMYVVDEILRNSDKARLQFFFCSQNNGLAKQWNGHRHASLWRHDVLLETRVSQNLAKLGAVGHKMSGMEGGENWSKLGSLGGRVSTLALILEGEM